MYIHTAENIAASEAAEASAAAQAAAAAEAAAAHFASADRAAPHRCRSESSCLLLLCLQRPTQATQRGRPPAAHPQPGTNAGDPDAAGTAIGTDESVPETAAATSGIRKKSKKKRHRYKILGTEGSVMQHKRARCQLSRNVLLWQHDRSRLDSSQQKMPALEAAALAAAAAKRDLRSNKCAR